MEQALDVRTLIRMQSLLIAQTKASFSKRHKSMLKLQRHGRKIDLNTMEDQNISDASIIYGSDNDKKTKNAIGDKEINNSIDNNLTYNQ